jgi:hypothetical protein
MAEYPCGKPVYDIWMDSWYLCSQPWGHSGECDH